MCMVMLSKEQNGAQMRINLIKADHGINMTDRRNPFREEGVGNFLYMA